jgi:hypothetical protein
MLTNHDANWTIDDLTDGEIYAAIRYLEVDRRCLDRQDANDQGIDNGVVICVCLSVALLLADMWFYWQ